MTETLNVTVDRRDGLAVIYTEGYINNQGGEEIAKVAYKLLDEGYKILLLNLAGTKIVNSIGISILIEIIEKMLASLRPSRRPSISWASRSTLRSTATRRRPWPRSGPDQTP